MQRQLLLLALLVLATLKAGAQLAEPCPSNTEPASDDCSTACIYCNFNGYMGSTAGYTQGSAPGFCGTIENEQWLGFIAGAGSATFTATPSNCQNGDGVQIALYASCNDNPIECNVGGSGNGNFPVSITATMTPGVNYFLLIDGFAGDQCDFTITVVPPNAVQAPNVGPTGAITGPTQLCPGANATFTIPPTTGAGAYIWNGPAGSTINGQSPPVTISAIDGGNTIQVVMGSQGGQICVQPVNSCDDGNQVCKTITVAPIPPTNLPPVVVCNNNIPYELPWGDLVNSSGTFETTLSSWRDCDSIVRQQVTIKPPIIKNLSPIVMCAGDCFTVCGELYCDGGNWTHSCESYQGCDSIVNFAITILDPVAEILGGGVLSCSVSSITLNSSATGSGTKIWKNGSGQVLGAGNTLTVTQPGTIILTTTAIQGGVTCAKSDTIVITGNTIPPTVAATGGTLGCSNTIVQLGTSTNATNPAYIWSGPGGFSSNVSNPVVNQAGTYIVTVTNATNGCTNTASAVVTGNTTAPQANATGGTLSCSLTSILINATSNVNNASFQWTGPNGFSSSIANPLVSVDGNYIVTVTDPNNGCTASATAIVNLNNAPPGAIASGGTIGCNNPLVTLSGNSTGSGPAYAWTGPNGFSSALQNPQVGASGAYVLTVTGSNGCTSTATANVDGDTNPPNAVAQGGTISCGTPTIVLNSNSSTNGVTFGWSGPAGFSSTQQNPVADTVGTYIVTVTGPNGCTSTATALVSGDYTAPDANASGGVITCSSSTTTISGSSTFSGVTYTWNGPGGFTSNQQIETVNTVGDYTLIVTSGNGCSATAVATVSPDSNLPNASANGGTLNCNISSVILDGGSSTQNVTLVWNGPGGFTSTQEDPQVTEAGTYILTVSAQNGCTAQATAVVDLDDLSPGATATGGTLTCTDPSISIQGNSGSNNVTWLWSGPGGFNSTNQNPVVNTDGTYSLTVTGTNGCTSETTVAVLSDQALPVVTATAGTLTCTVLTLQLTANASLPVTYDWTGPGNFSSTEQTPTALLPGDYTVIVTASNGCTDQETVTLNQDITPPDVATTGNTLNCVINQVVITGSSNTPGVQYSWSGPGGFSSSVADPIVNASGDYIVTVTAPNGCTSTGVSLVDLDTEQPTLDAQVADILTCSVVTVNIDATVSSVNAVLQNILWSGPNGFASNLEDPAVDQPGSYVLVATLSNGCTAETQVSVSQDIDTPDAFAFGGTLTCTQTSILIDGSSITPGVTYSWSGPGNFTSTLEDPTISESGDYILTVTGGNGCTQLATATVDQDIAPPGVSTTVVNNLDCNNPTALIQGNSPTFNVSFLWTGTGVNETTPDLTVSQPGNYQLEVTGPNGCTSIFAVSITQDITPPGAVAIGDTIDCVSGNATLIGNSPASGVSWLWSGPGGFSSPEQNPVVSQSGNYDLVVTGANGCSSAATTFVAQNTDSPVASINGSGTLTCLQTSIVLTGVIVTPGANGQWLDENGNIISTLVSITVTNPGIYDFEVTADNGCISIPNVTIFQNIDTPEDVTASGGQLDCVSPTISLNSSSSTSGVSYSWTGPGGFTSTLQNPVVSTPGDYTVMVTNDANGCTVGAPALVTQDPTVPSIFVQTGTLTCLQTNLSLNAETNTSGVTFNWSGPGIVGNPALQTQTVSQPGNYSVVATASSSGCTATFDFVVGEDVAQPGVTAEGDTLTCTSPTGAVSAVSLTQNVQYVWTGPGGFQSQQASPQVTEAGTYTIVVTAQNGCTSSETVVVAPDASLPVVTVLGGTVTCAITSIQLSAMSNNPDVTWSWTGPGNFSSTEQNPTASQPGTYTATAEAPNGCATPATAVVIANTASPAIIVNDPDKLDCTTATVTLSATVPTPGDYTFQWTTQAGNILMGATSSLPTVSSAAVYSVVVTNNENGCTASEEVEVETDPATPSGAVFVARDVDCFGYKNGSIRIESVIGGTPPYLYSVNGQPFSNNTLYASLAPASYPMVIQDANGCEWQTTVEIGQPDELNVNLGPDTTIQLGESISLYVDNVVTPNDRPVEIQIQPADLLLTFCDTCNNIPLNSFIYHVIAVDTNGCRAEDDRKVIVQKKRNVYIPNIFNPESATGQELFMIYGGIDVEIIRSFRVFNRWGELVHEFYNFSPNDISSAWNGLVRGQEANPAVFVYYAEIKFIDGEIILYKGDVTLVRN